MKKTLLLLFLLSSAYVFSQKTQYEIRVENFTYRVDRDVDTQTSSDIDITLYYSDGTSDELYHREIDDEGTKETDLNLGPIETDKEPVRIHFHLFINFRGRTDDAETDEDIYLNGYDVESDPFTFGATGLNPAVYFNYSVCPPINLVQPASDNNIGYDKEFTLAVKPNSAIYSGGIYNWQYHVEGDGWMNWRNMPTSTNGEKSFTIKPKKFLEDDGFSPQEVINKKIDFRINTCGNNYSNKITYTIRKSAPSIVSTQTFQAKCYGGADAAVRVYFDRQIDPGEKISYVLYDTDIVADTLISGKFLYVPVRNVNNLTEFKASAGNFYLDIDSIPPSKNYKFEIIGSDSDTGFEYENGDPVDVRESGYGDGAVLYTGDGTYSTAFNIPETEPVEFEVTDYKDITCNGTEDGIIKLSASGGKTGEYQYIMFNEKGEKIAEWTNFSKGATHTISIAEPGHYKIMVEDSNECPALGRNKDGEIIGGEDYYKVITIDEPEELLASVVGIDTTTVRPSAPGFSDGIIAIEVQGGNHNNSDYEVTWYKNGAELKRIKTSSSSTGKDGTFTYNEQLINVSEGDYAVEIWDSERLCADLIHYTLTDPDPLAVDLSIKTPISCNSANSGKNISKSTDGKLIAVASGGVAPYIYTWMKLDEASNKLETVYTSPELKEGSVYPPSPNEGIGAGTYAVNIEDANGIVLGTYKNDALVEATPVKIVFDPPDPIKIEVNKENVFCKGGNNAWMEISASGGTFDNTENYQYQWKQVGYQMDWSEPLTMKKMDGQWVGKINNLEAADYKLKVFDSNGCFALDTVTIDEPDNALKIKRVSQKQPKATGLTDGYIQYKITGGTPKQDSTYTYEWIDENGTNLNAKVTDSLATDSEGAVVYFIKLNTIGKGTYHLTVTDANYTKATSADGTITANNAACVATDEYKLKEPTPLKLTLTQTKVISCNADNAYGNPFSNGELTAHASGGEPLQPNENDKLPYYYTWKKKIHGVWDTLQNQKGNVARGLSAGIYAVNIKDANGVVLGTYGSDNKLIEAIDSLYTLKEPPLLEISTTQQNVYCFSGSDGWAKVHITGGKAPYVIDWSTGDSTKTATGLSAATYQVHVTDSRGCEAIAEVKIDEPDAPVTIAYPQYNRPSSIGATDAWIEAVVTGGTPFEDGRYTYFWQNEGGTLLNAQTSAEVVNGEFTIRLKNIPDGNYYLTVQDKNYEIAETKLGCTHADSKFAIYEPIEATITIEQPISCHSANEYQDAYSDGALVAEVKGGVPFESGRPYIYHWKKQNASGQWEVLPGQSGHIARNLSDGNYALNVEDARGTVMGIYTSDVLVQAIDSTFYLQEPDLLEVSFATTEISCDAGNNGTAEVFITGGTPPYNIKWSNGETTSKIQNLIGGTYVAFVTDSRGCQVTGNVTVAQPSGIRLEVITQKNPTCFQGNDGAIRIQVTGGVPPYAFQWDIGEKTNSLSGLSQGSYTVRVTDNQGCIVYKEVVLEDPDPVIVDLGRDRTLCRAQEFSLDIAINDPGATYAWESDNGFTSNDPQVTLRAAGIYTATITTALGCTGQDQIRVMKNIAAIDADFLITSQAFVGEEVVMVNVSDPLGEATEWFVPDGVTVVSESNEAIILKFKETGAYEIRLRTLEGDCYQDYTKQIVVKKPTEMYDLGEAEEPFLKKFVIYPNPNNGSFKVEIQLAETADVALRLISLLTADVSDTRMMINKDTYMESYEMMISSGTYILLLETPKGKEIRRVIIK